MNPDQPSREQIEARLTALLLGELPAAEAELLRWTIARDPELQKLHDQLKVTIGFVREAMKNPTGVPVERETLLKMSEQRRQAVLAHFRTVRPQKAKLSWLRRIEIPSRSTLAIAAVIVLVICGLAAISIPNFVKARSTSQSSAIINNLRQIDAAKHEWALEKGKFLSDMPTSNDLTPYLQGQALRSVAGENYVLGRVSEPAVAEFDGKALTASSKNYSLMTEHTFGLADRGVANNMRQITASANERGLEQNKSTTPIPQEPKASLARIALPNTTSSQEESEQETNVFSQNVVGYVNIASGASGYVQASLRAASPSSSPPPNTAPTVEMVPPPSPASMPSQAVQGETSSAITSGAPPPQSPLSEAPEANGLEEPARNVSKISSAPESVPPTELSDNLRAITQTMTPETLGKASVPGNSPSVPALMPPRLRQQYAQSRGILNGAQWQGQPPPAVTPIPAGGIYTAGSASAPPVAPGSGDSEALSDKKAMLSGQGGGGGGGIGGVGGAIPFNASANNAFGLSLPANTASWNLQEQSTSQSSGSGFVNGPIANGDLVTRYRNQLPPNSVTPLMTRESQNASIVSQSSQMVQTTPILAPPTTGVATMATTMPRDQSVQQYKLANADSNEAATVLRGLFASTYQGNIPVTPQVNASVSQPEILTRDNALSTFALNVSDVSFKLAMASLQKGQLPDPASIRGEEFINAFDYHDPEPLQDQPLAFTFERAEDPFAHERDVLRFSIKAGAAGRQAGRALNLVLLLDTSGSMERADRVAIIREALRVLSAQLQPQDTVSVVTFARTARLWADGVAGDQAGATLDKVGSITPEGGTNLEEAMRLAYETALRHFIAGGMNRVALLTDGAANLGNVDPQALTQKVDAERRQGIALDCFGIGWDDYNDDLLEQLSSNGDGRYAFINSPDEAATEFAAKLAGALQVAAEDVKVQVEFNPNRVTAWRQIGYAKHQLTKEQFRDNSVAAGAIAAREAGNALYVIETLPGGEGPIATVRVRYRVPGTQDIRERSWLVEYTGPAPALAQSSPAMRLAVCAAEISEWLADSPFAQDVTPDELLNYLNGVPQFFGADERPKQLEWMIREAKSVSGK